MSHRQEEKEARRAERLRREQEARRREQGQRLMRRAGYGTVGLIAVVLVAFAVLGGGNKGSGGAASAADPMSGASASGGPAVGAIAPNFKLTDVVSGKQVTRTSLGGHKTLLFFSEGVGCQACMVQAADLQKDSTLAKAGVKLVSVTTDPADQLAQAASQYGIRTPLLADPTTSMSGAYGMLAHGGMQHAGQDGHAFMLLSSTGKVLWHEAYQEMYVKPSQLLSDMGVNA